MLHIIQSAAPLCEGTVPTHQPFEHAQKTAALTLLLSNLCWCSHGLLYAAIYDAIELCETLSAKERYTKTQFTMPGAEIGEQAMQAYCYFLSFAVSPTPSGHAKAEQTAAVR